MRIESAEEALRLCFDAAERRSVLGSGDLFKPVDVDEAEIFTVGAWATIGVRLPTYHSEMPSPFLEAYSEVQASIYRIAAFIKYDIADIRVLTNADLEHYQLVVRVSEGSANLDDNVADLINRIAEVAFGKMSGRQAVLTILGLGVLFAGSWGWLAHLDARKEVRLAEIASVERRAALESVTLTSRESREQVDRLIGVMMADNEASRRAAAAAAEAHTEMLKAASKVDETEIGGVHITREEAKELRASPRRRSATEIVEQEMRVVDVNTADPASTTIILEDLDTQKQHKVTFSDRVIAAVSREVVISALAERGTALFKIIRRSVEGDVVSVDILSVTKIERDPANAG